MYREIYKYRSIKYIYFNFLISSCQINFQKMYYFTFQDLFLVKIQVWIFI